jgi:hypothetical protein
VGSDTDAFTLLKTNQYREENKVGDRQLAVIEDSAADNRLRRFYRAVQIQ